MNWRPMCLMILAALGLSLCLSIALADEDCPAEYEDCMTVTAPRITCEDGWICSDGMPRIGIQDCWRDLTGMPNAAISSPYGEQREKGPHNGIDIAVPTGTTVYAAKDGVVSQVKAGYPEGDKSTPNGNFVRITYDDGTEGVYLHLLEASVKEGWSVDAGDAVGESNDTGFGSGPHLHYTQYADGTETETVDPAAEHSACG